MHDLNARPTLARHLLRVNHSYSRVALLVAARTASTATADTLNGLVFLQLGLGHAADAGGIEIGLFCLDAAKTAQLYTKMSQKDATRDKSTRHKKSHDVKERNRGDVAYLFVALFLPLGD